MDTCEKCWTNWANKPGDKCPSCGSDWHAAAPRHTADDTCGCPGGTHIPPSPTPTPRFTAANMWRDTACVVCHAPTDGPVCCECRARNAEHARARMADARAALDARMAPSSSVARAPVAKECACGNAIPPADTYCSKWCQDGDRFAAMARASGIPEATRAAVNAELAHGELARTPPGCDTGAIPGTEPQHVIHVEDGASTVCGQHAINDVTVCIEDTDDIRPTCPACESVIRARSPMPVPRHRLHVPGNWDTWNEP